MLNTHVDHRQRSRYLLSLTFGRFQSNKIHLETMKMLVNIESSRLKRTSCLILSRKRKQKGNIHTVKRQTQFIFYLSYTFSDSRDSYP
jgi:hypothetical protein